jgi:pimeloyl-ACP methyl ester carboxylesterase
VSGEPCLSDPFHTLREVEVRGGALCVAQAGPPPGEADAVVLAVHGITSSHVAFRATARELGAGPGVCLLAPDLRGRGHSTLPGPYGFASHEADLLAALDDAGVERVILAGHSMGAYVGARLAADHPDRVAALVLVDGGLLVPIPAEHDPAELLTTAIEQTTARLRMTFESVDEYVGLWRDHPALLDQWNDDVDAYARYDMTGEPPTIRCVVSTAAVAADCTDLMYDEPTRTALDRVRAPIRLLRAERGLFDDDPVLPESVVDGFAAAHPDATVEMLDGANHYTLIFAAPGPQRIAAAIRAAIPAFSGRRGI